MQLVASHVRETAGVQGASGPCHRRYGCDHPGDGPRRLREKGVDIRLGTPVNEIIVERGRAAGAVAGGATCRAAAVVAGINPKLLFTRLLSAGAVAPEIDRRMASWRCEIRDLPDERRFIRTAAVRRFARRGRPSHGRHHHRAVAALYGPRLSDRARTDGFSKGPVVENADPLDPGR